MLLFLRILLGVTLIAIALVWWLSAPVTLDKSKTQALPEGNPEAGAIVFAAAGCGSCHTAPDAEISGAPVLSGGRRFPSPYGTFVAPNISPHPEHGIGDWSTHALAQAMQNGVSPDGQHYFPAFPYTSYANATLDDINDLHAYLKTLPASDRPNEPHNIGIPFSIRRGLGLWKQLYLRPGWVVETAGEPELERGRYLVEALGHCAECHTPRTALGGLDRSAWLAGAP
ncbi:MAG: cytochrome c, partial [Pseudomonadota bacterium]